MMESIQQYPFPAKMMPRLPCSRKKSLSALRRRWSSTTSTTISMMLILFAVYNVKNVTSYHPSEICADDIDFSAAFFELDPDKTVTGPKPFPAAKDIREATQISDGKLPAWWWDMVQPNRNQTLIPDWYLWRLRNCTVIDGSVRIRNYFKPLQFAEVVFPNVREITGSVLVLRSNLDSLSHVFPNLRVIRGRNVLHDYAFVVLWNDFIENIGLPNLTYIGGAVRIEGNKRLCYVNSIDFNRLAPNQIHYFAENSPVCFEQCASNCSTSAVEAKSSMGNSYGRTHRQRRANCWSGAPNACQKLLPLDGCPNGRVPNSTECCHRQCLPAGCSGPKDTECVACLNVNHQGRCLDSCPPGTFQTEGDFCLTEKQCINRKMKNDRCMYGARGFKPYFGKCLPACPKNWMESPTDVNRCVFCNGTCPKVCDGDFSVTDVSSAKMLAGCTEITGNLQIQIRSGPARRVAKLREFLGSIEVIGGSLRVIRSVGLKSLSFFDSLRLISGSSLYLNKFAIFIHDNPHLAELFNIPHRRLSSVSDASSNANTFASQLEIGRGLIFMESNPKLCLGGIGQFVRNITFLTAQYTFEDLKKSQNISEYTNGNKGVCESLPLNLTVQPETSETAFVQFDALPGDYDYRIVLYYTVAWRRVRPRENPEEISYFDEADACGSSQLWHSIDVEPQFNDDFDHVGRQNATIHSLSPNTYYAVIVSCRTSTNTSGYGGPVVFITNGANPGNVRQLRGEALSSNEIRISWLPPLQLNGNLTGYFLEYRPVRTYKEDFYYSNLCNTTIGGAGDAAASTAAVSTGPSSNGAARSNSNSTEMMMRDENGIVVDDDEGEQAHEAEHEGGSSMMHTVMHDGGNSNYAGNQQHYHEPASGDSSGSMLLGSLNGVPCCSCSAPSGAGGATVSSIDGGSSAAGGAVLSSFDDGGGYSAYAENSGLSAEDARAQHIEFTDAVINSIYLPEHRRCDPEKNKKQWWYYVDNYLPKDEFDGRRFKRSVSTQAAVALQRASGVNAQVSSSFGHSSIRRLHRQKRQHDVIYPDASDMHDPPPKPLTENSTWEEIEAFKNYQERFEPKYSKKYQQTEQRNAIEYNSNSILQYTLGDHDLHIQPISQLTSIVLTDLDYFTHYKVYVYAIVQDAYGMEFFLDPADEKNINMPYVTLRTQRNETADDIDADTFELIRDANNHTHVFLRWEEPPNPNGNMTSKFEIEVRHEHYSPNYECISMATYTTLIGNLYNNHSITTTTSPTTAAANGQSLSAADRQYEHERLYALAVADLPPGVPIGGLKPGHFTFRVRAVSPGGAGAWTPVRTLFIEEPGFGFSTFGNTWALPLIIVLASLTGLAIPSFAAFYFWRRSHKQPPLPANMNVSVNPDYEWERAFVYEPDEWEVDREHVKLLREVGKGSFGLVYEGAISLDGIDTPPFRTNPELLAGTANYAGDTTDNGSTKTLRCAVKTVGEAATPFERYEFLHEAGHMKKFACHHIVSLLGVVSKGQPVLVLMEYMARGDLRTWLRTRRPTVDEPDTQPPTMRQVLKMAAEIADGMMYLAVHKFVHRDLAARNCLVADDLTCKLGDFGMTRDIYQDDYYRKSGRGMLPVRWMAPESLCDGVYTSKSDVWSFGVVLWEMATLGAQPYQGLSNEQTLAFVRDKGIMGKPEGCPEQLFDLMQMCWRYSPDDRPSFARIIEMLLPDLPPSFNDLSFYRLRQLEAEQQAIANGTANSASQIDLEAPTLADEDREEFDALLEDEVEGERKAGGAGGPHAFKFLNSFLDEGPQLQQASPTATEIDEHPAAEFSGVDDIQLQFLPSKSPNVRIVADGGYDNDAAAAANGGPLSSGELSVNFASNSSNAPAPSSRNFNAVVSSSNASTSARGADGDNGYTSVMRAVTPTSVVSRAGSVVGGELPSSSGNTRSEYDPIVATLPSINAAIPTTMPNNAPFLIDRQQQQVQRAKFFAAPLPSLDAAGTSLHMNNSSATAAQQQRQTSPPSAVHKRLTPPLGTSTTTPPKAAATGTVPNNGTQRRRISSITTMSSQNSVDAASADASSNVTATTHATTEAELDADSSTSARRAAPPAAAPLLGLPLKKQRNSHSATLDTRPITTTGDIVYADNLTPESKGIVPHEGGGGGLQDHRAHSEALLMIMRANPSSNNNHGHHRYSNTAHNSSERRTNSPPSLYPPPAGIHHIGSSAAGNAAVHPPAGSSRLVDNRPTQLNGNISRGYPLDAENSATRYADNHRLADTAKSSRKASSDSNRNNPS